MRLDRAQLRQVLRRCLWWMLTLSICMAWAGAGAQEKKEKKEKPSERTAIEVVTTVDTKAETTTKKPSKDTAVEVQGTAAVSAPAVAAPPPGKGGILSSPATASVGPSAPPGGAGVIGVPQKREEPGAAGNVVDATGKTGPGDGTAATGPVEGNIQPLPLPGEGGTPKLPEFAEQQPGFIPDTTPGELFVRPGGAEEPKFDSALGASRLDDQAVEDIIGAQQLSPASDLPDNFARIVVPTGTIEGSTESKQFHIEGGLIIYYSNVMITGETADIDEKQETALITGDVNIVDPKYTLKTDELKINFGEKRFEASGFVQFNKTADPKKSVPDMSLPKKDRLRDYFGGQQFELYCTKLFYNWDSKEMTAVESVQLKHPFFNGTMEQLEYNDESKSYGMSGSVEIEITNYEWIFATRMADDKDEPKLRAITDNPTKVSCEQVVYSDETGVAEFYALPGAQVVFDQNKRGVKASYIEINDKTKDFYAEGTPEAKATYTQTDGEWLYSANLVKREEAQQEVKDMLANPLQAVATSITYNFDLKRIEMRGGTLIKGQTSEVTADELVQDETAKFFLLHGNVHIKAGADNEVYASQVYVDTSNDVVTFVGLVQGQTKSADLGALTPGAETPGAAGAGAQAGQGVQGTPSGTAAQPGVFGQNPNQLPPRSGTNVAEGG